MNNLVEDPMVVVRLRMATEPETYHMVAVVVEEIVGMGRVRIEVMRLRMWGRVALVVVYGNFGSILALPCCRISCML